MTDRELLELAAKAAGMNANWNEGLNGMVEMFNSDCPWNPLEDDGDALRLSVKLNICINFAIYGCKVTCDVYDWDEDETLVDLHENNNEDLFKATRRAIVRAAAEIGKSMP